MFKWLTAQGRLPGGSTVGQIDYGVEIVSTDGKDARWDFHGLLDHEQLTHGRTELHRGA